MNNDVCAYCSQTGHTAEEHRQEFDSVRSKLAVTLLQFPPINQPLIRIAEAAKVLANYADWVWFGINECTVDEYLVHVADAKLFETLAIALGEDHLITNATNAWRDAGLSRKGYGMYMKNFKSIWDDRTGIVSRFEMTDVEISSEQMMEILRQTNMAFMETYGTTYLRTADELSRCKICGEIDHSTQHHIDEIGATEDEIPDDISEPDDVEDEDDIDFEEGAEAAEEDAEEGEEDAEEGEEEEEEEEEDE